jgi:hypothetical protein
MVPRSNGQARPGRTFTLVPFADVKLDTSCADIVQGLIPCGGLAIIWGPPKCGKSFWTFDMAMHVALGWEYRGRRVHQGTVVYLALEGGNGFKARIEAFRQRHGVPDAPFYLIADRVNLVADHQALLQSMRNALGLDDPVLIVIDTLNRSLAGSESKDEDMAAYIAAADAIRSFYNCAVAIVHHCGVDGNRPRGHTSLSGAADAQLAVSRDAADNILVDVEWLKDGREGDRIVSRLEPLDVGTNDDDDPIASCVIVPVDGVEKPQPQAKKVRQSEQEILARRALVDAINDHGIDHQAAPRGSKAVTRQQWANEFYSRGFEDKSQDTRNKAFNRAATKLHAKCEIGERDGYVWIA